MTEQQQKKLTNGEALLISKTKLLWIVLIWLVTQAVLFGIWKGTTDTVLETKTDKEQVRTIVREELNEHLKGFGDQLRDIKSSIDENRKDIKELLKK